MPKNAAAQQKSAPAFLLIEATSRSETHAAHQQSAPISARALGLIVALAFSAAVWAGAAWGVGATMAALAAN